MHALSCLLIVFAADLMPTGDPTVILPGEKLEQLWNDGEFTEGVASAKDGTIYFSDIAIAAKNPGRIMKFDPKTKQTTVHVADSGQSNGLFFGPDGRLFAVCGANVGLRALVEITPDRKVQVLVDRIGGKRFNAPNDVAVHPKGWVFFSDPHYVGKEPLELDHMSVYRYDPATKAVERATTDITKPNGVIVSPDGKTLYVAETDNGRTGVDPDDAPLKPARYTLNAFPIGVDGKLGPKRVLHDFGKEAGIDGMKVDTQGRLYAAVRIPSRHGIAVFTPEGKEVAFIPTEPLPTNCNFGRGADAPTLYITAGSGLYRIKVKATGYHP
ncbi:MAG: SMP-30/gluconolactonase/LRE family protein [Planctomycetaceae bacterium]|nr:SMP-30/gluconolactonase/LRE family protein [Planctomycetaceae bacterium]